MEINTALCRNGKPLIVAIQVGHHQKIIGLVEIGNASQTEFLGHYPIDRTFLMSYRYDISKEL